MWFLLAVIVFTGLAGAAWLLTHIPLPPEVPQAQTSIVYDGTGSQLALFHGDENRFPVRLDQVPKVTQDAVVAAEDRKFFEHSGVDPLGIVRATWADIRHKGALQGGSTITQQYVKNAFVSGSDRTLIRKLREAVVAVKLEQKYSKQQILERYLNTVYFGRGAYGIQAAAKAYYQKDASQLDLKESAYLAGIIRSPSGSDVSDHPAQAKMLRTFVLNSMITSRVITPVQAQEVERVDLASYVAPPVRRDTTVTSSIKGVDYFVEYVKQKLRASYSDDQIFRGGMRVYTTLDPRLQNLAYDSVYTETLDRPTDPAGALVSLDNDGHVVAMVGGKDWEASKVNLAAGAGFGGNGRQGGSTFKPFLLAETIKEGYSVQSSFNGPAKIVFPKADNGKDWKVSNYEDSAYGQVNLIDATVNSINTVYAQLVTVIGPQKVAEMAHQLGIKSGLGDPPPVSITLGTPNVSVMEMADAYLTFANEGNQTDPRAIKRLTVGDSVLVDDRPKRTRVLEREQADMVNFILGQVIERGSGTAAQLPSGPAWGKTGTTEDNGDAWFIGFNRKLTTAVWMGYPAGQSVPLVNVHGVAKVNGGSIPAEIWRRYMSRAAPDTAVFPVPTEFGGRPISDSGILPYSTPTSTTVVGKSSDSSDSSGDSGATRKSAPTSKPDVAATPPTTSATVDTEPPAPRATSPPATANPICERKLPVTVPGC
ncbi:MAG: penicillin-binding protein [Actinomycetota bacterium]|nr:penicillin-binding protein [Actinomycetota bacterium]